MHLWCMGANDVESSAFAVKKQKESWCPTCCITSHLISNVTFVDKKFLYKYIGENVKKNGPINFLHLFQSNIFVYIKKIQFYADKIWKCAQTRVEKLNLTSQPKFRWVKNSIILRKKFTLSFPNTILYRNIPYNKETFYACDLLKCNTLGRWFPRGMLQQKIQNVTFNIFENIYSVETIFNLQLFCSCF